MTHLGLAINRLMLERPNLTAVEVAKKTGVSTAYISRLRSGERSGVTAQVLSRLATALTNSSHERAELIAAHLKDESCGYYPNLIQIQIRNGKPSGNRKNR